MQNINTFLKENLALVSKNIFIAPNIPEKKLNNVAKVHSLDKNLGSILAIYDNTLLGSAKDGIIFTGKKFIVKESFQDPYDVLYADITSVDYVEDIVVNEKGKESRTEFVSITLRNEQKIKLKSLMACDFKKLADILTIAFSTFNEFEEENQLVTLAEMPDALKEAYIKIIINMSLSDGLIFDKKRFSETLLLMTRLELTNESRFACRSYMSDESQVMPVDALLDIIDKECIPSHNESIRVSLVKDLISIFMSTNDGEYKNIPFLQQHQVLLGVNDDKIEVLVMAIQQDLKMLKEDFTDDVLKRSIKELTAKAGAVGVPVAAIYLSGSVVGMSAAGITSGLATLGLGGILGFSGMATGIGVAVLLGVGAYKGVRHFTGANELDKTKRRELMLTEVIRQTQTTLSILISDLNYLTGKFNEALSTQNQQSKSIEKLQKMMSMMIRTADELNRKSNNEQGNLLKIGCPTFLDKEKLNSLTQEPIKKQFNNIVLSFYEEVSIEEQRDEAIVEVKKFKIKEDIKPLQLEKLVAIFEDIGYFKVSDVIKGRITGLFS